VFVEVVPLFPDRSHPGARAQTVAGKGRRRENEHGPATASRRNNRRVRGEDERAHAPSARSEPFSVTFAADSQGQFLVEPIVNGIRLRMLVDTGASLVVLSREDARRLGINPAPADFWATVSTANGAIQVAPVLLKEIKVGELSVHGVPAAVLPDNKLQVGLLGMSFLSKLSHFEVASGRLVLKQ